jgi:hypothetical protein
VDSEEPFTSAFYVSKRGVCLLRLWSLVSCDLASGANHCDVIACLALLSPLLTMAAEPIIPSWRTLVVRGLMSLHTLLTNLSCLKLRSLIPSSVDEPETRLTWLLSLLFVRRTFVRVPRSSIPCDVDELETHPTWLLSQTLVIIRALGSRWPHNVAEECGTVIWESFELSHVLLATRHLCLRGHFHSLCTGCCPLLDRLAHLTE